MSEPTHERNVLVWLVSRDWRPLSVAVLGAVLLTVGLLLLTLSCVPYHFAQATDSEESHEVNLLEASDIQNEQFVASLGMYRCRQLGLDVTVYFSDVPVFVDGTPYGLPAKTPAAAVARMPDTLEVYTGWLDEGWTYDSLDRLAQHECAHLCLGHFMGTEANEASAAECVEQWGQDGSCVCTH